MRSNKILQLYIRSTIAPESASPESGLGPAGDRQEEALYHIGHGASPQLMYVTT